MAEKKLHVKPTKEELKANALKAVEEVKKLDTPVEPPKETPPEKIVLQNQTEKKPPETTPPVKVEEKPAPQTISPPVDRNYQSQTDINNKIEEAIKGLRPVNIPSKIEIVHKNIDSKSPNVVQHVSDYSSQKTISKSVTYVLIGILIVLLIALGAVFLFKDDLIKLFNDLGLA